MASLSASQREIVVSFIDKVVVFKREGTDSLLDALVFPIEPPKSDGSTPISDGSAPVVTSSISSTGKYFAVASGKKLILFDAVCWNVIGSKTLVRAASCINFTNSEDKIVVADKSGDVYLFHVPHFRSDVHPNGALILGHVSMLLRIAVSPDDSYVLTCDRDEKIRVSRFPHAYNIETFCLGHTDAVTCMHFPASQPGKLLSGSSDGSIRLWDYSSGQQLLKHDCDSPDEHLVVIDLASFPLQSPESFLICAVLNKRRFVHMIEINYSGPSPISRRLEDIPLPAAPRALSQTRNELFVLSSESPNFITAFTIESGTLSLFSSLNDNLRTATRNLSEDFFKVAELTDDRLHLNKRKIDDTQEYYMRKRERLQNQIKS